MAEKKIGLRIELNGFRGVISNIKEFENELNKAKEDLKELEIGGALFQQLTGEIQKAETELGKLRKQTEGISTEKQVEGYGKLAAGITGGFAAATAAVSLFGAESEQMSKATLQAQNLITLALSARSIAELKTGVSIVKTTIATQAEALATKFAAKETTIFNTTMKGLFTTISANPIGAMVSVLGLAIAAIMTFSSETEEATQTQKDFNEEINKDAGKGIASMKTLVKSVNDTTLSMNTRKKALDDLSKMFPAYFEDLDKEKILTGEVKIETEKLTGAIMAQAKARALQGRLEENAVKALEYEDEFIKAKRERIKLEKELKDIQDAPAPVIAGGGITSGQVTSGGMSEVNKQNQLNAAREKELSFKNKLTIVNNKMIADEKRINDLNRETDDVIGTNTETINKNTKSKEENVKATQQQTENYNLLDKSIDNLTKQYADQITFIEKLSNVSKQIVEEPQVLKTLRKVIDERDALFDETWMESLAKIGLGFTFFRDGTKKVVDALSVNGMYVDKFGESYTKFEEDVTKAFFEGRFTDIPNIVDEASKSIDNFVAKGQITPEAVKPIYELMSQYKAAAQLAKGIPPLTDIFIGEDGKQKVEDFNKSLEYVLEIEGQYGSVSKETKAKILQGDVDYSTHLQNLKDFQKDYYDGLLQYYKKDNEAKENNLKQQLKNTDLEANDRIKLEQKLKDTQDERAKGFEELADKQSAALIKTINTIAEGEATIFKTLDDLKSVAEDNVLDAEGIQETYIQAILKNLELFTTSVTDVTETGFSKMKNDTERIAALDELLKKQGVDVTMLVQQQKLDILKAFLDKEAQLVDENELKKQETIKKTIEYIDLALNEISSSMSKIASITAQRFSLELSKLSNEYNNDMQNIVGDTEEANNKRIELEKIYQKQKKDIEKQAEITSLKFSMAQAITDGAQAILNIWSTHAANPILAGILTGVAVGITAYQVDTINQQLQMVQSMRRGGILMGGGLAMGPSHEQGGIYAGGGSYIEGNEAIINRQSTLQYSGLLSQINQSGGGRPIMVQSPMDSRLVEALAKQKQEPIRAYVIEQDITKAQSVNKRLEQLASF
jgi:hypothetical protein